MRKDNWPERGDMVWVMECVGSSGFCLRSDALPIARMVNSVDLNLVQLEGSFDRPIGDCYPSRTLCEMFGSAPRLRT